MNMWYWGEQELPGLQAYVDQAVAAWADNGGGTVDTLLQDTDVVISQFQTAAAANNPPDMQFLWNGIYHMESVWFGYLSALNGLVGDAVLGRIRRDRFEPLWRQSISSRMVSAADGASFYNKVLFDNAGLGCGLHRPQTWDELAGRL